MEARDQHTQPRPGRAGHGWSYQAIRHNMVINTTRVSSDVSRRNSSRSTAAVAHSPEPTAGITKARRVGSGTGHGARRPH